VLTDYHNLKFGNMSYLTFIIPGIIIMVLIQETFTNISNNIVWMKHSGTFNDLLMSPLSRIEILISFLISNIFIGIFVAFINLLFIYLFFDLNLFNISRFIYYITLISLLFGSMGAIVGFLSFTWEVQQSFLNFIIIPLSFLSGTFFSIEILDEKWKNLLLLNPFYYLVLNARKSFEINSIYYLKVDLIIFLLIFLIIFIALYIYKKGYRVIN
tara:strand:- start:419 stop:1057 length:639 start_codon:yes stop_codon:yes gene_type:complete